MSSFLDTNVLAYALDADAPARQRVCRDLISEAGASGTGVISTQVMQEFFVTATRKLGLSPLAAKAILKTFTAFEVVQVSPMLIQEAIDCSVLNQLSFWDALIVASAAAAGCETLYTEDLNAGQTILGVTVRNPVA